MWLLGKFWVRSIWWNLFGYQGATLWFKCFLFLDYMAYSPFLKQVWWSANIEDKMSGYLYHQFRSLPAFYQEVEWDTSLYSSDMVLLPMKYQYTIVIRHILSHMFPDIWLILLSGFFVTFTNAWERPRKGAPFQARLIICKYQRLQHICFVAYKRIDLIFGYFHGTPE